MLDASLEVRSAVVYASLIVALVFLPVFFLGGLAGSFFRPLASAYIVAILASLLVALTVTPALCAAAPAAARPARLARRPRSPGSSGGTRRWLPWFVDRPARVTRTLVVALGAAVIALPFLGEEFLPHFREYDFLMHWVEKPGTSIDAMRRVTILRQPGPSRGRRRAQLRVAHRARRGGRRSGRAELHRAVDQPRPQGRLRRDGREGPAHRGLVSRACIATC